MTSTPLLVVAVALVREGRVLMQQRRDEAIHGGLWEFPGGKVDPGETPEGAAIREIAEELGVALDVTALEPVGFASGAGGTSATAGRARPIVILLYLCHDWTGEPVAHDAAAIEWVAHEQIAGLDMPPLDYPLAEALCRYINSLALAG